MFDSIIVLIYIVCAIYSGNKIVSGRVEWLDRKQPANMIVKGVLILLIGLLILFSLNKCTVACNRDTKINKQQTELVQKDSIIKVQADSLNISFNELILVFCFISSSFI